MNIFFLSLNPIFCAKYHTDVHVRKMIIEYAQLLCVAHRMLDGILVETTHPKSGRVRKTYIMENSVYETTMYKCTHKNHPCALWARQSSANYKWLYNLFLALCDEYKYRFNKTHLSDTKLRYILSTLPSNIPTKPDYDLSDFPQTYPDNYTSFDIIENFQNYYKYDKMFAKNGKLMHVWTKRSIPSFFSGFDTFSLNILFNEE